MRLRGCEYSTVSRAVLYKRHEVSRCSFAFGFADGSVVNTVFCNRPEYIDAAGEKLGFHEKESGLKAA